MILFYRQNFIKFSIKLSRTKSATIDATDNNPRPAPKLINKGTKLNFPPSPDTLITNLSP
ncbi:hypothetical protein BpHYR1_027127 [Brachionus plicatilis]|uniref:Uncharacterized protein n=1 Tax=Brachionus plicatilis TaxID=10195 RepID=A0A3M7QDX4_BRAPC|nr:hypothetical protein BpHYR1_027127 [Brachionus plicatilis]